MRGIAPCQSLRSRLRCPRQARPREESPRRGGHLAGRVCAPRVRPRQAPIYLQPPAARLLHSSPADLFVLYGCNLYTLCKVVVVVVRSRFGFQMEDSVGEEERREQEETMAQGKERDGEEESGVPAGGGEPGEEGGFLSSVASKIGAAMSGANGSNGAEEEGRKGDGNGDVVASDGEEECKKGGDGGGGIFNKLLSSSPASSPASEADGEKREGRDQDGGREQAGILSAVASKIGMAMSGAKGIGSRGSEEDAKASNGDAADQSKREDKGDEANGGGIVKQLISNLPSDDQAPEADEASLLIAIIQD